ncbi:MAG: hypothetical protein KJ077_08195 [Anaerolineae bacterium]|nr:hypothetical protein [Anaerolineae bacterium]
MSTKTYFTTLVRFVKLTPRSRPTTPRPEAKESRTAWLTANGRQTVLEVR